ncbi:Chthon cassette protein D [compost metagenome]
MQKSNGFTLIELMVVIAIIAILASIGVPSFRTLLLDNRLTSTSTSVLGALQFARSEAITLRARIRVCAANANQSACANSTNWGNGALVMRGNTKLRSAPPAGTDVSITSSRNEVEFAADGTTDAATITVGDDRPRTIEVKVNAIGQACSGSACS